ncbi:MAG: AsnC family protein [Gammaproteobacteria bacterium]|nr:AsnC family protein [Gammaproteobacteria bacterium]MBP6050383.1 AsnC family protein [Pseudomonadales bacterium]MBK6583698.1 AsnC family protein [Gammaproteobacteria bacterium]MBK7170284.1 AsnC family protein [Gammaproteobacteria bacterium]MBK7522037.1 AsnC family protein [Gammaproteobacteria bacterium]
MGFYFFRYTDEHDEILCDGWVDGENLASPRGSIDVVIKEIFAILPNRNILSILQQDGRISFSEPARRVGLSTTH